ncbi:Pkinase-domain-containing protein [Pisolithus croceorrhizus]|nr:Pkinase-domain-containing protein [Pisolithus croceorrhizus]
MSNLQIPDSSYSVSSRQHGVSRPVSVSVQPSPASASQSASRRQRASHQVVSSQQHQQQSAADDQPAYRDVYSHPAAVAYATAHPRRTIPKFGPYLLLQTLGEGEFGKVKLGLHCQWGEEVAVKLIRRGNIDTSVRMSKVEREIEVLRTLKHPNIVRLYDVIETDKYIGIILEYASGGELFDHILAHRYLKEKDAAKLFSQLISGVWYIHQKKIVHRDLKLENLLLDRHRNVIITDFGFANRFEHRADDLMQTSCGSPCYAAPELVISEGLYVGSAVDVWSCGVILYAMLAGYLPFDDDPANPDGDNINLLYKYIVNTPLSFPEYVSQEARDLLSMMLVPDPTRRADLHAIMVHPWLSAHAHVFTNEVVDLERMAMEQHQMKRLAYQRQMRQSTAAAANPQEPSRVSRTQSARVDGMLSAATSSAAAAPRSHSYRDNANAHNQPEYLYETSVDQSLYSSSSPQVARQPVSVAISSSTPVDDDPFAALPTATASIPVTVSAPDEMPSLSKTNDASPHVSNGTATQSPADPKKKGPSGFRHTIQVEYPGELSPLEPSRLDQVKAATPGRKEEKTPRKPSADVDNGTGKPLPSTPTAAKSSTRMSNTTLRDSQPLTPTLAVSPASPPGTANIEEKSAQSVKTVGSSGSASSRHRKGLSIDKFGLGKIFGSNSESTYGYTSRVPSESSAAGASSALEEKPQPAGPSPTDVPQSASRTSLLSPTSSDNAKKNRRNTLTVMVEPFSRTIKNRKGKTPTGETPAKENRDLEKQAPISSTASPKGHRQTAVFPSMAKDGPPTSDNPASTIKARNVMQWFRKRSNAKVDLEERSSAVSPRTDVSVSEKTRNGDQSRTTPAADISFSFSRAGWKFTSSAPPKDVLRIHHGAVDQTTITTSPPPEVMKRICQVLEELGMEFKAESEYKYRCVRAKRKKGGSVGLGFSGVGTGNGLAAFAMVGSAASNGVDKRGLPLPSNPSAGGMLKGLLMRRQSSQVSGVAPTPPSLPADDENVTAAPSPVDQSPGGTEPIYGDSSQDAGDEVRFSVELTRIDRLKDTYSLDIRRLKGNLRSYKFLYDTIRECVVLLFSFATLTVLIRNPLQESGSSEIGYRRAPISDLSVLTFYSIITFCTFFPPIP